MKQLIIKDIINSNIFNKFTFIFLLVLSIILTVFKLEDFLIGILFLILMISPLSYYMNVLNYTDEDFYKLELLLPIKIYKIVLARYVEYFFITIFSVIYISLILFFRININGFYFYDSLLNILILGISSSIIFSSFFISGSFLFGNKNIKIISLIAFISTLMLIRIFMEIINYYNNLVNIFDIYNYRQLILIIFLSAILIYLLSFLITFLGFRYKLRKIK